MSVIALCQVLAFLLIFTAWFAIETGSCEHPCEACKVRRARQEKKKKALAHEWHLKVGYRIDGCADCDRMQKDKRNGDTP